MGRQTLVTYIPYQSDFSTADITALADAWSAMAGTFAAETATMDTSVQSMAWTGNGYTAAINAWDTGVSAGLLEPVPAACQQIADNLTAWAQAVEQYQQQTVANIQAQENADNITGLISVILFVAGLVAAPFLAPVLGLLGDLLDLVIPGLRAFAGSIPALGTTLSFTGGAVAGAGVTVAGDALVTWVNDDLTNQPFSLTEQQVINDIITGGLTGGVGALDGLKAPSSDPAGLVTDLPGADTAITSPAPPPGPEAAPVPLSGESPASPLTANATPEAAVTTPVPEGGLPPVTPEATPEAAVTTPAPEGGLPPAYAASAGAQPADVLTAPDGGAPSAPLAADVAAPTARAPADIPPPDTPLAPAASMPGTPATALGDGLPGPASDLATYPHAAPAETTAPEIIARSAVAVPQDQFNPVSAGSDAGPAAAAGAAAVDGPGAHPAESGPAELVPQAAIRPVTVAEPVAAAPAASGTVQLPVARSQAAGESADRMAEPGTQVPLVKAAEKLIGDLVPQGPLEIHVANLELPSFSSVYQHVLVESGPPIGVLPEGIPAGLGKLGAAGTGMTDLPGMAGEPFGNVPPGLAGLLKKTGWPDAADGPFADPPPRYEPAPPPGHGPAPIAARDPVAGGELPGAVPAAGDHLSASALHDDPFGSGFDDSLVRALGKPAPAATGLKLPETRPGGPGFDPEKVRDVIAERQRSISQQLDDRPSANPGELAGTAPHTTGTTGPAEQPAGALDQPSASGLARSEHEQALDALAHAVAVKEELAAGGRPGGTYYQPEKKTGTSEPPGRWTQLSRDLEQITTQRRPLLDEQARLQAGPSAEPPAGPQARAVSGRLAEIGGELKKLDDSEAKLFTEQVRQWGKPRAGNLEPKPATNKNEIIAELKKVTAARREVLSQRTDLAGQEPAAAQTSPPGVRPGDQAPAEAQTRLAELNQREAGLLAAARQLEHATASEGLARAGGSLPRLTSAINTKTAGYAHAYARYQLAKTASRLADAKKAFEAEQARFAAGETPSDPPRAGAEPGSPPPAHPQVTAQDGHAPPGPSHADGQPSGPLPSTAYQQAASRYSQRLADHAAAQDFARRAAAEHAQAIAGEARSAVDQAGAEVTAAASVHEAARLGYTEAAGSAAAARASVHRAIAGHESAKAGYRAADAAFSEAKAQYAAASAAHEAAATRLRDLRQQPGASRGDIAAARRALRVNARATDAARAHATAAEAAASRAAAQVKTAYRVAVGERAALARARAAEKRAAADVVAAYRTLRARITAKAAARAEHARAAAAAQQASADLLAAYWSALAKTSAEAERQAGLATSAAGAAQARVTQTGRAAQVTQAKAAVAQAEADLAHAQAALTRAEADVTVLRLTHDLNAAGAAAKRAAYQQIKTAAQENPAAVGSGELAAARTALADATAAARQTSFPALARAKAAAEIARTAVTARLKAVAKAQDSYGKAVAAGEPAAGDPAAGSGEQVAAGGSGERIAAGGSGEQVAAGPLPHAQPATASPAQARRALWQAAQELVRLRREYRAVTRQMTSPVSEGPPPLPGWVLPGMRAGQPSAAPSSGGQPAVSPASPGPSWDQVLARYPLPSPGTFEFTHVRSGVIAHALGTTVPGRVLAEAGAVVPDAGVFRVFIDPRQAGAGLAGQVRGYLDGLPRPARGVLTVYVTPGTGQHDLDTLSDLAGQLVAPVTAMAGQLTSVPPASPRVTPLSAAGRMTGPGRAAAFEVASPAAAPPAPATRPAPPLRSALKNPGARPGPGLGETGVRQVQFAPEQITGGWFFPLDHDDPTVRRAAGNLPGFEDHHVVAVHFNQQAGRFEADGRQYGFSEFAARLASLPGWVPGRPVVLVSCVLASISGLEAFAASLGSDVLTGLDDVWRTAAGDVISAPVAGGGQPAPDLSRQAGWLRVSRNGTPPARYHGTLADVMSQLGATALGQPGGPDDPVAGRWPAPQQDVRFSTGFGGFGGVLTPPTHASGAAGSTIGPPSPRSVGGSDRPSLYARSLSSRSGIPGVEPEGMPDRELPPGFGVEVGGVRQYPMGHRGRFVRLGEVRLGDDEEIAGLVAAALPAGSGLAVTVTSRVLTFLGEHGNHAFIQRLLEGGLTFNVSTKTSRQEVTVGLDLGDPVQWVHRQQANPENRPVGDIEHGAVEADHEVIAGSRRTVASGRELSVAADVKTPFGALPRKVFAVTAGAALTGASSSTFTSGSDTVSAAKRFPVSHGGTAYFDFPGAALTTRIRPAGRPGPEQAGRLPLNGGARAGFPEEFAPVKQPGDPPGAFRAVPRTLPRARRLGVTQEQVDTDAVITTHDPASQLGGAGITFHIRQPTGDSVGGPVPARDAAGRLQSVLSQFLVTPESAGGLKQLRTRVYDTLAAGLDEPDADLAEGVEFFLSEPSFLRMWGDISGPGAISPMITGSSGRRAYLIVRAELRTVEAATIDHVPVKEELQRFTNVVDEAVQSGQASLTLPQIEADYTIGAPAAPYGGNSGVYVKGAVTGTLSADRSQLANTGSGDIRGVVFHGESVRYTTHMHLIVQIARDSETPEDMPRVEGDVIVALRVPGIQRARFEALIDEAVHQSGRDIPVDDEPGERITQRYPPESMAAGQGMGFSAVGHLHKAEAVLPAILDMVRQADEPLAWARPWDALDLAYLRSQLSAKFTREALASGAAGLFQPGGETMELFRPARDGAEVIAVTVRAERGAGYIASGRIGEATLEVMPSAFAGNSAADTVGTSIAGSITAGGGIGLGDSLPPRSLGASVAVSGSRTHSATTRAQASGFGLEAMLYEGPARYFDYGVRFRIDVRIHAERSIAPRGWLPLLSTLAKAAFSSAGASAANRPAVSVRRWVDGGSARLILPEMLTRDVAPDHNVIAVTGQARVVRFQRAPRRRDPRRGPDRTVTLPDVRPFLGPGGHLPLNPDDQVMEVLGSQQIGRTLKSLLRDAGMSPASIGDLHWTVTSPVHLSSSMVRGPSVLMNTIVQDGIVTDRHAVIRIEGYPTNARQAGAGPVEMFQMHVAEGDGTVSSSQARGRSFGWALSGVYGLLAGMLSGGEQQVNPSAGYAATHGSTTTRARTITPTSGRLTQAIRQYTENTADMVWRISVTAHDQNVIYRSPPRPAAAIVTVQRGISFLRLADPGPDPRFASGLPTVPGTVPEIRRTTAAARPGARQVPVMPSTPGSTRTVPIVALIPPSAASERLFPMPPAHGAVSGPAGVTGDGNPVLDAVRDLLEEQAPELLEAHWTIENDHAPQRRVPASLQNVLNLGSLTMLMDLLLGPGLILSPAARSVPLAHERAQIVLRARRDPANQGYAFLEHVESANVSRYAFRLDIANSAKAKATGKGWTVQAPAEATVPEGAGPAEPATPAASPPAGPLNSAEAGLDGTGTGTVTADGYRQSVEASRDTLFIDGPADRYGGEVEIQVSLSTTYQPSRLANAAGMTLPQKLASQLQQSADQRRALPSRTIRVKERVLIPLDLIRNDTLPEVPAGAAAIEETLPGAPLPGPPLNVTRGDILNRQLFNLGFDHEKLQVLFDEVIARLAGNETPQNGQHSAAVRRLTEHGTIARHALHYMLSYQMLTRQLEFMLDEHGFTMPGLVREGGPLTDTHGQLNVAIRLVSPQVRGYFNGWLESVGYHFAEFNTNVAQGAAWSTGGSGGPALTTGDRGQASPVAPQKQNLTSSADVNVSGSATRSGYGVLQTMTRAVARNRRIPWLRVGADAVITVTLAARNQRDKIDLPGGTVTVSFRVRNALELGVSPEASIRLGLLHRDGIPVPAGRYFPRPGDDAGVLAAVFNMPLLTRDEAASQRRPAGRLDPTLRDWFTVAGHYDYQRDTFYVGSPYPAGTPFPEPFRLLNQLSPATARFGGAPDLTAVEFAAHLWSLFQEEHAQFHGRDRSRLPDLVIAAAHAGAPGPVARPPFAQRVAGYLHNQVLASRAHVYHTPLGQTWSVNYWFDTAGQPLAAGAEPDTGEQPASSRHHWIVFNGDGPLDIQPASHDLHTVITEQIPDNAALSPPGAAPRISPPPTGFTLLGQFRPRPGSALDGDVDVTGGLVAGPLAGHRNLVVLRSAGSFDPANDLTDAERALIRRLPDMAGVIHLFIAADVSAADLPQDDLAAAVEEAARTIPPDFSMIMVHHDQDDGAGHGRAAVLAEHLSDRFQKRTVAANAVVSPTQAGLFAYAEDNLAASWWRFEPAGPGPVRLGALASPGFTWQVSLEQELENLRAPAGVTLHRIPAGLAMLPPPGSMAAQEYAGLLGEVRGMLPDPQRATLAVDLRVAPGLPGMLNRLIGLPLVHYLTPPALIGRPRSVVHPEAWTYGPWLVEQVPAGLWLHPDQSPAARRAEVAGIPAGPRYQVIVDSPVLPGDWDTAGRVVAELLQATEPHLALTFQQDVTGRVLDTASEIVAGLPPHIVGYLPRPAAIPRSVQRSATLDDDDLAALQAGSRHVIPHPVLARAHLAGGTFPATGTHNARLIYELSPGRTDARDATVVIPRLARGVIIPEGALFGVLSRNTVIDGDGRPITEIVLTELQPAQAGPHSLLPPGPEPQPPEPEPAPQPPEPQPPELEPQPPGPQPQPQPPGPQPQSSGPQGAPGVLPPGWQWLDAGRRLAVPIDPALTGGIPAPLPGWRAAEPGAGRGYAVHLATGILVLDDSTVVPLSYGWVQHGTGLAHYGTGVTLTGPDARAGRTDPAGLAGLRGAAQFSREDLLAWLADRGALTGPVPGLPSGPGWQQVTDVHGGRQWMWGGPGPAVDLPPGLARGRATASGLRCLTDSLAQLLAEVLPDQQRGQMTLDFLTDWFQNHLPVTGEAYQQMLRGQMVDVWSVLPTFTSLFQVRVQVFQHVPAGPDAPATILASRLAGPSLDRDGNPTPVLHLYWRGEHFEPLFAPGTRTARLPVRAPLGGRPPATAGQPPAVRSPGTAQPPPPAAGAPAPLQPASFGPVVRRPRRGQYDPSAGRFTQRLGGDVLDGLRRRVLDYLGQTAAPSPGEDMISALVAVLAEAEDLAGAGAREEWWDDLIAEGLTMLPPAVRQASFYAGSLPGIDAGRLAAGREVTVDGVIRARTTPAGLAGDTIFVITSSAGRDVSRLAGGGSDLVMFDRGRRFEVTGITQEPGGPRVIALQDPRIHAVPGQGAVEPADPGSRPMPLPPADFDARPGSGTTAPQASSDAPPGAALPGARFGAGPSHSAPPAGSVPGSATGGLRIDPGFDWDDLSDPASSPASPSPQMPAAEAPAQAPYVIPPPVMRETTELLYRSDSRSPDTIFAGGFRPRTEPQTIDLDNYVQLGADERASFGLVSTSRSRDWARDWRSSGYLYVLDTAGGIDVAQTLSAHAIPYQYAEQDEVAFTGHIPGTSVRGAWEIVPADRPGDPNSLGRWIPNHLAHGNVGAFAGLPAEAVAIRTSDGAYMVVPSGAGTISGMDNPLFFTAGGDPLGGVWLADTWDDGHEVFFSTIQNDTRDVRKVTYLVMWYLAKHATAPRVRVGKVANQGLAAMLARLGMVEVPGRLLAGLPDMAGDRQTVYQAARQAAIGEGWILRDTGIQEPAAGTLNDPEPADLPQPAVPAGLETGRPLQSASPPPWQQASAPARTGRAEQQEEVMRYRSGNPAHDLDVARKSQLIQDLLEVPATIDDQLAAFILLRTSDDADLAGLFGDGEMLPLLEAAFPADGRTGAVLQEFLDERFEGGRDAVAAGQVDPHGYPARRFDPALVSQVLAEAVDLTDAPAGGLTASQAAELASPPARLTADGILGAIGGLPPVELERATWWLTRARVAVHDRLSTEAGETRQELQVTLNEMDSVLTLLYRRLTYQTDAATLQSLTVTPQSSVIPRLRSVLDLPGPAFTRQLPGAAGEFTVSLRAAMIRDIGLLQQRYPPGRGAAEHADPASLFPMDHIARLARQAKEWVDGVFGQFATARALVPDQPGQRGNIHDAFADADREIREMDEEGRVMLARSFLRRFLTWPTESAGVLSAHHADPRFGPEGEPLNDEAQIVRDVIGTLAGDPGIRSQVLALYRAAPGKAQPETSEIWIDVFRRSTPEDNQRFLWSTAQTLIHEYLHLLEHPRYTEYSNSLGPGTHAQNALLEGVVSLLTEIVWSEVESRTGAEDVRALIEGEYAAGPPLPPDRMPHPAQDRYPSHAEAMRLLDVIGSVENLFAAFFLGDVEKIAGPHRRRD